MPAAWMVARPDRDLMAHGRQLTSDVKSQGWEGTIAKRIGGATAGRRTNAWIQLTSPAAIGRDRMRVASALRPAA